MTGLTLTTPALLLFPAPALMLGDLPDDVLADIFRHCDTRTLGRLAPLCRRLLLVTEVVAAERVAAAGWPPSSSFTTSAIRASRLVECRHRLPNGSDEHVRDHRLLPLPVVGQDTPHVQLPVVGARPSPGGTWACAACGLGSAWINGSDGSILCGRRQYDGSGGNGCALRHAARTQRFLVIKVGTVRADLAAGVVFGDAFLYSVRDEVLDSQLPLRLARLGIDPTAPGAPPAPSMEQIVLDSNARKHVVLGRWLRVAPSAVPDRLVAMGAARRDEILDAYFHASRAANHALRAAVAPAEPQASLDMATLRGQQAALAQPPLAALLAAETEILHQQYNLEVGLR